MELWVEVPLSSLVIDLCLFGKYYLRQHHLYYKLCCD